jgi:hypothetical protein
VAEVIPGTQYAPGEKCTSGCRTKDHASYHECLADKRPRTFCASPSRGFDGTREKRWNRELDAYADARRQGIQPDGTTARKVEQAVRRSDEAGMAYGRDFDLATPLES